MSDLCRYAQFLQAQSHSWLPILRPQANLLEQKLCSNLESLCKKSASKGFEVHKRIKGAQKIA